VTRLGAVAALAVCLAGAGGAAQDPAREAATLARDNAVLEKLVTLATGKNFYLVLDPSAMDLTLMLRGAELRRYHVLALSVGVPRRAWVRHESPAPWQDVIWTGGRLDPPREIDRQVIVTTPPGQGQAEPQPVVPPTPEEAYPVPLRYHIRFGDGPAIEIRPREADAKAGRWSRFSAWWSARWRDARAALRAHPDELVRLRVVLAPEDADMLYRSLPPDTALLVATVPGGGGSR
jgi:hypothetical protein